LAAAHALPCCVAFCYTLVAFLNSRKETTADGGTRTKSNTDLRRPSARGAGRVWRHSGAGGLARAERGVKPSQSMRGKTRRSPAASNGVLAFQGTRETSQGAGTGCAEGALTRQAPLRRRRPARATARAPPRARF
jgi:hypothetical protein